MKVKAIAMGWDGFSRVKPGTEFDLDDSIIKAKEGALPRWVMPADAAVEDKGLKLPGHKIVKKPKAASVLSAKSEPPKSSGDSDVI